MSKDKDKSETSNKTNQKPSVKKAKIETVEVEAKGWSGKSETTFLGHKFTPTKDGRLTCKMPKLEAEEWAKAGQIIILENEL